MEKSIRYTYGAGGVLSRMAYPDGKEVDYARDLNGRVTEIAVSGLESSRVTLLDGVSYLPFGPISGWRYGSGRTFRRTYDMNYHLVEVRGGADGVRSAVDYNSAEQVVGLRWMADAGSGGGVELRYDGLGRIATMADLGTGTDVERYEYDATGNRTRLINAYEDISYAYESGSHRLVKVGSGWRSYDAAGNTVAIGESGVTRRLVSNLNGRLSSVWRNGAEVVSYSYNGLGERVARNHAGRSEFSIYDAPGKWIGKYPESDGVRQQVVWLDSLPVGIFHGDELKYLETDHLGAVRVVVDPERDRAIWQWPEFGEAFGSTEPSLDPDLDGELFHFDMRFPGQLREQALDVNYNYFRDYDPVVGRYLQSDPIGLQGGISTYGYAGGRPLEFTDPLGLVKWTGDMRGGAAAFMVGVGAYWFSLTSECIEGRAAKVGVLGIGLAYGVGSEVPVAGSYSTIEFEDKMDRISPEVLEGWFVMYGASWVTGFGLGAGLIQLGGNGMALAKPKDLGATAYYAGPAIGLDVGLMAVGGSSTLMSKEYLRCECE